MKKFCAQQITEFMLAIPLLIAFFAILTEFAFAINAQLVLSNTLKSSVAAYGYKMSEINRDYKYPTGKDVENFVKDNMSKMKLEVLPQIRSLGNLLGFPRPISHRVLLSFLPHGASLPCISTSTPTLHQASTLTSLCSLVSLLFKLQLL